VRTRWAASQERRLGRVERRYRDDVRRFCAAMMGWSARFASRICGSADIYTKSGKGPEASINFVTCHDGFTLNESGQLPRQAQ